MGALYSVSRARRGKQLDTGPPRVGSCLPPVVSVHYALTVLGTPGGACAKQADGVLSDVDENVHAG